MVDESKQLQGNKDGDKHQTQELTNTSGNSQPSAPTPAQVPSVQQQQQQKSSTQNQQSTTGSARSSQGRSNQPQYSQADLNRIVLEYLNKKGYHRTEAQLRLESSNIPTPAVPLATPATTELASVNEIGDNKDLKEKLTKAEQELKELRDKQSKIEKELREAKDREVKISKEKS